MSNAAPFSTHEERREILPMWMFGAAALLIAGLAFAIGQLWAGMGVPFVACASTLWVAFVATRARKMSKKNV